MDLNHIREHYASLDDLALRADLARGPNAFVSAKAWDILVTEARRRGIEPTAAPPSDTCPQCGQPHSTDHAGAQCPHCGASLPRDPRSVPPTVQAKGATLQASVNLPQPAGRAVSRWSTDVGPGILIYFTFLTLSVNWVGARNTSSGEVAGAVAFIVVVSPATLFALAVIALLARFLRPVPLYAVSLALGCLQPFVVIRLLAWIETALSVSRGDLPAT
jgi:hypothetical protein